MRDGDMPSGLSHGTLIAEDGVIWGPRARFAIRAYASEELPPDALTTSARCIVTRPGDVLVIGAGLDAHVVPGGRRRPGESLDDTVRREVLEETGWMLGPLRWLGYVVYRHIDPMAPGYAFPYPVFVQVVFTAAATRHMPAAMCPDENDGEPRFLPIDVAERLPMAAAWRAFLRLAISSVSGNHGPWDGAR